MRDVKENAYDGRFSLVGVVERVTVIKNGWRKSDGMIVHKAAIETDRPEGQDRSLYGAIST
jgi:hypothetical protein